MGWTSIHVDKINGKINRKSECDKLFTDDSYEVFTSGMHGTTYYGAIKRKADGYVFAVVVLTRIDNRDWYNFSFNDMDETMEPFYYDCPKKVLNVLSPTENHRAIEWRRKCRERDTRPLGSLPVGTKIKVSFSSGNTRVFVKRRWYGRKKAIWLSEPNGETYITSQALNRIGYEIIS